MSSQDLNVIVDSFIDRLKRRQINGTFNVSLETLQILMRYVSVIRWSTNEELLSQIRSLGNRLEKAQPYEFSCGSVIRRILAMVRDEIEEEEHGNAPGASSNASVHAESLISSMFNLLEMPADTEPQRANNHHQLHQSKTDIRQVVIRGIRDLIDEIKNIDDGIQQIAINLIHDREILLTPTPNSKTVLRFLLKAKERNNRDFTVLVIEGFPNNTKLAHEFAKKLSQHGIETIIIPDSAVFALMSRVGKVIIGVKSVFTNGGAISSTAGVSSVCECAREFKTPVFAVAGLYKLSPLYPFDIEKLVEIGGSQKVVPSTEKYGLGKTMDTINPLTDYIPPENIDIYITNIGGFAPSFIYRVVWDNYKQEDVNLASSE